MVKVFRFTPLFKNQSNRSCGRRILGAARTGWEEPGQLCDSAHLSLIFTVAVSQERMSQSSAGRNAMSWIESQKLLHGGGSFRQENSYLNVYFEYRTLRSLSIQESMSSAYRQQVILLMGQAGQQLCCWLCLNPVRSVADRAFYGPVLLTWQTNYPVREGTYNYHRSVQFLVAINLGMQRYFCFLLTQRSSAAAGFL